MKFGNGCWLQKEGCECFAPQQVYFVNTEDSFNFKNKKLNMLEKIRYRLVYNRQNKLNRQGTALVQIEA